jgi:hypothetical protein
MADTIFEEYKAYYRTRAERFANNPNYKNSYEAEKNLADAFLSCTEMEEFRTKIGNLNHKCANALTKDKYIMEQAFFNEYHEIIRVLAANRILGKVDNYENVSDLITMVTEELNKNNIEISMDEANRQLVHDWNQLDNIEIYENAEVPSEYKQEFQEYVDSTKKGINEGVASLEENNSHWQSGWRLNPNIVTEHRHRRLFPYKDEHLTEQLQKYKSIINR